MNYKTIKPPKTIGIIGAGQLGLYMCQTALNMGYKVITYDPDMYAPAHRISHQQFVHSFNDEAAFKRFYDDVDVITFEFENVDLEILSLGINKIPQGLKLLSISNHRYREHQYAQSLNIPVVKSVYLNDKKYNKTLEDLNLPLIQKTCMFGYDGKGQNICKTLSDLQPLEETLVSEFIDFDYEISVVVVAGKNRITSFPPIINNHKNGVLESSIATQSKTNDLATDYARLIAKDSRYIGTMAVEFFVKDGAVIFNEIAPRPHNSGHYTLVGAPKSQFQLHIEAISGFDIDEAKNHDDHIVMVNILGQHYVKAQEIFNQYENAHYYEYGKKEVKENRKMGHIIFMGNRAQENAKHFLKGINNEL